MTASHSFTVSLRRLLASMAVALPLAAVGLPTSAAIMISQIYGGGGNSGAVYTNDYVELHNSGAAPVSLAGWSIQYASATGSSWSNTTALSGTIPAGGYFLIQLAAGAGTAATLPTPDVVGGINMSATAGKVALVNSTTLLTGTCPIPGATVVDFVGFGSTANCAETANAPAPSNSTALLRATTGNSCLDSGNNSTDFSVVAPSPRNSASPPGACNGTGGGGGGGGGGPPTAAAIYTIQGSGSTSPLAGQLVVTSGVVTKITNNGFFIQDLNGDGNPATSDGIFVFSNGTAYPAVAVGNLVEVTATVTEFNVGTSSDTAANPLTELTGIVSVTQTGSGYTINPVTVTLPLAPGDSLERFEGMLVKLVGPLTVQQNYFQARYGQLTLGAGGRHETPTNRYRPGTPSAIALADAQARGRILLDDGSSLQNIDPTPYLFANGVPRAGDTVGDVIGVIDYGLATATASGLGLYRIQPTAAPAFFVSNPRTLAPQAVGGNIRVAAMNVLNYFTTFTNGQTADGQSGQGCSLGGSVSAGNCRGADNLTEFLRQRTKLVREMAALNADAYGLMETQNNGNTAVQNLVDALNAFVGSSTYATIAVPAGAGATGTDAIRVTIVYKPARLTPVGAPASDTASINNRPTLAQTFMAPNGEKFTLFVNHLKSKGSCPSGSADPDADQGDGAGCWNATRVQQAQRLRTFVAQVQAASGVADALLVGDFNAYAQEDPIFDLTSNGYIDQIGRFNAFGYSYVFDGTAGRLDHAISTPSMSARITSATEWHINADEQLAYDYNLEFKQPACATCAPDPYDGSGPYRASDHDPLLVGVNLYKYINGSSGRDTLIGTPGDDIITGGPGADTLAGNGGSNQFVYNSVLDGGDTILDFQPGVDLLDFRVMLQSLGVNVADPIAAGYVGCTSSGVHALITVDPDGPAGPAAPRSIVLLKNVSCATALVPRTFGFTSPTDSRTKAEARAR